MNNSYIDKRGFKYKVLPGIGLRSFKARRQSPDKYGDTGWKSLSSVPWRSTFDEAQADLDRLAKAKGWQEWDYRVLEPNNRKE